MKDVLDALLPGKAPKLAAITGAAAISLLYSTFPDWQALLPNLTTLCTPPQKILYIGVSLLGLAFLLLVLVIMEYHEADRQHKIQIATVLKLYEADQAKQALDNLITEIHKMSEPPPG